MLVAAVHLYMSSLGVRLSFSPCACSFACSWECFWLLSKGSWWWLTSRSAVWTSNTRGVRPHQAKNPAVYKLGQFSPAKPSRGHVREYHYVLKMTSRHFQHVPSFTIDTFSTCCFGNSFSKNSCHFSAQSHLIGAPDYIFSTEPSDWCSRLHFQHKAIWLEQFQHKHLWLVGSFVIFSTEHFCWLALLQRTTIRQVASSNSSDILPTVRGTPF